VVADRVFIKPDKAERQLYGPGEEAERYALWNDIITGPGDR
jgi:hypothetical protein